LVYADEYLVYARAYAYTDCFMFTFSEVQGRRSV